MVGKTNVSVCMAVYNGEKYLGEQIESILIQLQDCDELIICDDMSTDKTQQIIRHFQKDKRIKFIQNKEKKGVVKNFENVLMRAQGEYIFLCDQDDVWIPGKVNISVEGLQSSILVVTDCIVVDDDLKELIPSFFIHRGSKPGILNNLIKNGYLGCCMAFRRELLAVALPIPKNAPMHDMWLGLVAETIGNVSFIKQKLLYYRRHGNNLSPTAGKSSFSFIKKIAYRFELTVLLIKRHLFKI